jgi:hypothetical protein
MKTDIVKTTAEIKEITVIDEVVLKCEGVKLCFPEAYFEMIETCKLCEKCV